MKIMKLIICKPFYAVSRLKRELLSDNTLEIESMENLIIEVMVVIEDVIKEKRH